MNFSEKDLLLFLKTGWNPFINPNKTVDVLAERMKTAPTEIMGDDKHRKILY